MNNDVYIYERKFFNDVVLVAINKNDTTAIPSQVYTPRCRPELIPTISVVCWVDRASR